MTPRWPRTLLGQNTLLLVATTMVSQIAAVLVFMLFVQSPRVKDAAGLFAAQIMTVEKLLALVPERDRARYVVQLDARETLPPVSAAMRDAAPARPLARYEAQLILRELAARLPPGMGLRMRPGPTPRLWVQVHIAGLPYWISLPLERSERLQGAWIAIAVSTLLSALAALFGYLIHRRINRPLRQLVAAAERLGKGEQPEAVSLDGPQEIAGVAATFNRMAQALAEIDATRALMLASISHDIRTPLTKLRLAIAMPELLDAPQASAERFIEDIDAIVQQFIDYGRGGDGEDFCDTDLNAMIEQLAADFVGLGQPFTLALQPLPAVSLRPVSMLRLLVNLMQNAALYGRAGLEVRSWADADAVHVVVADRGPGVDGALLELLKQPFRRGVQGGPEDADGTAGPDGPDGRSSAGSGLGLAIANRIAQQHGGSLALGLRDGGGFQAALRLPLPGSMASGMI